MRRSQCQKPWQSRFRHHIVYRADEKRMKMLFGCPFNDPLINDVYGLIFLLDFGVIDISYYILWHWICPCCLVVLVFVYSSSLNVQEYMVTISNKIIEDAVKAVREDCSMENIKWVDNIFYWFTWCEFECWFFRRLAETIKKYRPESMEVKNVRKLWSFQKMIDCSFKINYYQHNFFQLNKKTFLMGTNIDSFSSFLLMPYYRIYW